MTFELLISAVNKDPEELARTMRIASDALIVVQDPSREAREEEAALQPCGDASPVSEEAPRKDPGRSRIRCFRQKGRGVGRSRNAALSHAQADICLFGHTHIPYFEIVDGLYVMNPGAVCSNSYGIIDIEKGAIMAYTTKITKY